MISITGLGNASGASSARQPNSRDRAGIGEDPRVMDGLDISPEAAAAARYANASKAAELNSARIEEAKQQITDGSYRVQEAVLQVAIEIDKYIY